MQLKRFKWWREAFQILTEEEYKSSKIYSIKEIYQMYAQKLAKQRGVDVNQIPEDDLHEEIAGIGNYQNICIDGCVKVFNDLVDIVDEKPEPQSYDSTKASLIFKQSKKVNLTKKLCIAELFNWLKRYIFNLAYSHHCRFFKNFRLFK